MSLLAYAYDDVLVIDWPRQEKIIPAFSIQVDGVEVPKPLLGIEWVGETRYLWSPGARASVDARRFGSAL